MTITLEITPTQEAWLHAEAARRGVPVEQLAGIAVEQLHQDTGRHGATNGLHLANGLSLAQEEAELDALIADLAPFTTAVPPLRDDAVALAYEERENAQL